MIFAALSVVVASTLSQSAAQTDALNGIRAWASSPRESRPALSSQPFAAAALSRAEAEEAADILWSVRAADLKREREQEWTGKSITLGDKAMKFEVRVFGDKPKTGRSLFISMHGGGGAPKAVNDQQWKNQIGLYKPAEGVYIAPRAPTDTWNLWHEAHIDDFFDRIIENAIVFEGVDPNRVYLMGYSAGGDGVYQLAPRMADRFAAASMMAGHPNDAVPENLRNLPFAIHMGENDSAYNRNTIAKEWGDKLAALAKAAGAKPGATTGPYVHFVEIHKGKGHWMDREDASAVPWMAGFTRNPWPKHIIWNQSSRVHDAFAWLAVDAKAAKAGQKLEAVVEGSTITVTRSTPAPALTLRLSDALVDLERPLKVIVNGKAVSEDKAVRRASVIWESLVARSDRAACGVATVTIPAAE
jgi:poly(3-hydroxybutyrate) depolymerase